MPEESSKFFIGMDEQWSLEDLYVFPRAFEQVYFLMHSLSGDLTEDQAEAISHVYHSYPWQDGYSAVNFYNRLKYMTPKRRRPQVMAISYASPGVLELALVVAVAMNVRKLIKAVSKIVITGDRTYTELYRGMQERKLLRLKTKQAELRLKEAELRFVIKGATTMAELLDIKNVEELNKRTGHPYRTLKILMSVYRRAVKLAQYQNKGKADFFITMEEAQRRKRLK